MTATDTPGTASREDESSLSGMERYFLDDVRSFMRRTDEFVTRQYRDIITGSPSAEQLEQHRRELKWAIWLCRQLHRAASPEEFFDRQPAALLAGRLRQLEESWKLLFEPPAKEEGEKLDEMIKQLFPDAPRA